MICYKEIYGADVDNNRGMAVINYEITDEDNDEVCEKIYDLFLEDASGTQCILMYCHIADEDIEVEVKIEDYIDELIAMADADEDIKDDEDLQEWLQELKIEKANKMLKQCIKENEYIGSEHWIFIDFYDEDRFKYEIKNDRDFEIKSKTPYQMCLYACEQLGYGLSDICEDKFSEMKNGK